MDSDDIREWYLNEYFNLDIPLSERITKLAFQDQVAETIRINLQNGLKLKTLIKDLSQYTTEEDLPKYIRSIESTARRVINDETQYPAFIKTLMSVKEDLLNRLAKSDETLPNAALTKSYLKIVNAAEKLNESGLNSAIENAIDKKAMYNAFRIAQTETNRAYNKAVYSKALEDEDVIAMGVSTFNCCDDCAEIAEDIYDLDSVPELPVHPNCRCFLVPVYKTEQDIVDDYEGDLMAPIPGES